MIVTGHQPNYLPYSGFFHKTAMSECLVIVDNVQFVKRGKFGWMNRNKIRTHSGWTWLTVPVLTKGRYHQKILETRINNDVDWRDKHWKSILINYGKSPYFSKYADFFEDLYKKEWEFLADLSETIIRYVLKELLINVKIIKSSQLEAEGKGADLIIDICKKLNADSYVHGKHGQDYISEERFRENGIKCIFQEFVHPVYKQVYEPFIPNMSVIDLLFNCGKDSRQVLTGKL